MADFFSYMLVTTIRMGMPVSITSVGACFAQRTGVNNIGLEGIMAMGAFLGVVGAYFGNPWLGLLFAVLAGMAISAVHGFVTITCGGNMAVSSQALILLSTGVISVGLQAIFHTAGYSPQVQALTKTEWLRGVPWIGDILAGYSPFIYLSVVLLFAFQFLLYKTPVGLHMLSCGEYPRAAATAGVNVNLLRYVGVILSGLLGGLGGAIMSIGSMNLYQEGMISGRGFLAIGAVVLGRHSLGGAFLAGLVFGFFDALQLYVQTLPNSPIPSQFIQMMPYLASLLIVAIGVGKRRATAPAALGKSYSAIAGTK